MIAHERPGVKVIAEDHGAPHGVKPHLRVSWEAYIALIDELVLRVADSAQRPNQIVAILTGGFQPGWAISRALGKIPIAFCAAESYGAASPDDRRSMVSVDEILFTRDLLKTQPGFGTDVVVVDDLDEKGRTLRVCTEWLRASPKYGHGIRSLRTAVLWHKDGSDFAPDIFVDRVTEVEIMSPPVRALPWIDQPSEILWAMPTLKELRERVAQRAAAVPHP